ncbi:MAG: hypothetical protein J6N54_06580 [Bacteroidales bacterium]|nr:hypothetical protein [Bacteroidales bacterium]
MEGYVNGSDLLCSIAGKAVGHCTSHTATFNTETKDVAVKPLASVAASKAALFKSKRVTGLGIQVKADGLQFYKETESGFKVVLSKWKVGESVDLSLFERENDESPYLKGKFIISNLEQTAPAGEDASYSATFDNDGSPEVLDESKIDLLADD